MIFGPMPNANVLIRQIIVSESTGYGQTNLIKVPDTCHKEIQFFGRVLMVGTKAHGEVKVGDLVLVDTYAQYVFETGNAADGTLMVVPEADVVGVFPKIPKYLDVVPSGARELAEVA